MEKYNAPTGRSAPDTDRWSNTAGEFCRVLGGARLVVSGEMVIRSGDPLVVFIASDGSMYVTPQPQFYTEHKLVPGPKHPGPKKGVPPNNAAAEQQGFNAAMRGLPRTSPYRHSYYAKAWLRGYDRVGKPR